MPLVWLSWGRWIYCRRNNNLLCIEANRQTCNSKIRKIHWNWERGARKNRRMVWKTRSISSIFWADGAWDKGNCVDTCRHSENEAIGVYSLYLCRIIIMVCFSHACRFLCRESMNRFYDKYSITFDIMAVVIVIGIVLGIVLRHYKIKRNKDRKGNQWDTKTYKIQRPFNYEFTREIDFFIELSLRHGDKDSKLCF